MELFGVGLPELFFIVIIALIVLGPKDMAATGKKMGTWLRKLVMSPGWRIFQDTSREIRNLPAKLIREAGVDELEAHTREIGQQVNASLASEDEKLRALTADARSNRAVPAPSIENRIAPSIPDPSKPENKDVQTP